MTAMAISIVEINIIGLTESFNKRLRDAPGYNEEIFNARVHGKIQSTEKKRKNKENEREAENVLGILLKGQS